MSARTEGNPSRTTQDAAASPVSGRQPHGPQGALRLGFACSWDPVPQATWSNIPWNLKTELALCADVVDLGPWLSKTPRAALRLAFARRQDGRWVSSWKWSRTWEAMCRRSLASATTRQRVDAVLEIQDLAPVDRPMFLFQDLSVDVVLQQPGARSATVPGFTGVRLDVLRRRQARQHQMYRKAIGIFAMSPWFVQHLLEVTGLPRSKVHLALPGINAHAPRDSLSNSSRPSSPHRLLFVGKDFFRKGGDIVVAAVAILRRRYDPDLTLTVAGPVEWPLDGAPPAGVDFRGQISVAQVAKLYGEHDLFVMPSRFEAFGIVFVEALARGLPCVGRNAFAMPDIIEPGRNGALVEGDDPEELAMAITSLLEDRSVYDFCEEARSSIVELYSWKRTARSIAETIEHSVRGS